MGANSFLEEEDNDGGGEDSATVGKDDVKVDVNVDVNVDAEGRSDVRGNERWIMGLGGIVKSSSKIIGLD